MPHRLDDVAGAGLALRTDHARALGHATQRLSQVRCAADERNREGELVDVVRLVRRGEDLGLVDEVDPERLEDLGLDEVPDAGLRHDRDPHGGLDALDHLRVTHARDAPVTTDVGRNALKSHDGAGAGILGHAGLFRGDDVHDDAALQHLGEATLDALGSDGRLGG